MIACSHKFNFIFTMFEAVLNQAVTFKKICDALKEIASDVNITVNDEGMYMQAMDASHIALMEMDFKRAAFDKYVCDRQMVIGLNVNTLGSILKAATNEDSVTFRKEDDAEKFLVMLSCPGDDRVSEYELPMIRIDADQISVPSGEHDAQVYLASKHFAKVIGDLGNFGESLGMLVTPEDITFKAVSDRASTKIVIRNSQSSGVTVTCQANVEQAVSMRFMAQFAKACPISTTMCLHFSRGQPIVATFPINDSLESGTIRYFLAPKLEDE